MRLDSTQDDPRTTAAQKSLPSVHRRGQASSIRSDQLRGATIDLALGQRRELLVSRLFLLEVLLEQVGAVAASQLSGPCDQTAVAGDLVVLDRLCGSDNGGV